ncbi:MAG TPA: hypothetical protein VF403_20300, partial [Kofleriaceae bacterium]
MKHLGQLPGTCLATTQRVANPAVPFLMEETRANLSAAHTLAPTGARILIVDDNPRVRRSTAAALSRIGFHGMTAEDGAPAIQIAESTPPDLA